MKSQVPAGRGKWFFLSAFVFSCFLFWWLPSVLFRLILHIPDQAEDGTIVISLIALALFVAGYLFPARASVNRFSEPLLDACGNFAFSMTTLLFIPALLAAIVFWYSRSGVDYGSGDAIPRVDQVLLYTHLFFGFMFLGSAKPEQDGWRRISIATVAITLPRLIISLHGGRFFVAQAIMPAVLIAIARGWIRLTPKRLAQFVALTVALIFVPAMARGDSIFGGQVSLVRFFVAGGSLPLFQKNRDLNLNGRCSPLIVSLTAKTIPYGLLNECVLEIGGLRRMPATLGRILTVNDPSTLDGTVSGTGSNFLLDLFLFGGMPFLYLGTALFGFSCRRFMNWIGKRSLFSGIWAECLNRALFAPRNDLGYVYERIPSLLCTTALVILIVCAWRLLQLGENGPHRAGIVQENA